MRTDSLIDADVIGVLLERHPAIVGVDESLATLIDALEGPTASPAHVRDSVARLVGDGVAHRVNGDFVIASRAAVRTMELATM